MKIKRFEAASMPEALRLIKKEFGEDAVILSAKTMKKNRLLAKDPKVRVVVTAAIDRTPEPSAQQDIHTGGRPTADRDDRGEQEKVRASTGSQGMNILKRFKPITPTGQKKLKPKIVQLMNADEAPPENSGFQDLLISCGIRESIAADMAEKAEALLPRERAAEPDYTNSLCQVIEAKGWVGPIKPKSRPRQRIMVMLGPSGVGKTSAVAKLCAKHIMQQQQSVALISFDNQRIAGTAELERYARILGVPFRTVFDPGDVPAVLDEMAAFELLIVDTPGFEAEDRILCERLRRLVNALGEAERYLLINADSQECVMARIIELSRPFGIQRLFFTRMDWAVELGPMINQVAASNLPIAYLSDSSKVPDGIQIATAGELARRVIPRNVDPSASQTDTTVTVVKGHDARTRDVYYVANRNSDIFHQNDCKSVQRINTDNMIVFKDPSEAMGRQFKPCRMCCSELIFPKPIDRLARGYAGHRYFRK
jgi:flagellar biosynthesis protein FlhF